MPEISAMPILPTALTPPSTASSGSEALTGKAKLAGTPQASRNSDTDGSSGTPPAEEADSFANVLQRQLDQADASSAASAGVSQDFAQQQLAVPLTFGAAADDSATADLAQTPIQLAPENTGLSATSLQALNSLTELVAKGTGPLDKSVDDAAEDSVDAGLAAQSPYLVGLAAIPAVKTETASSLVEAEAGTDSENPAQFSAASQLMNQPNLGGRKSELPTNIADAGQAAANRTAEIAAALDKPAETAPSSAQHEAAGTESSFDNLLAAAQAFNQNRSVAAHAASHTSTSLPVRTPVNAHGWDGEVGDKLVWMVGRQEQRAELVLNPPQLGRVEVSLTMNAGQASALFVSANPAVRDALEAAMPRLREILSDAGVTLGQAQVGADAGGNGAANQSTNNRENWDNSGRALNRLDSANGLDSLRPVAPSPWLKQANGLVDVFA